MDPNHGKTEVSSRFHYALDTTNPDNNYHSGNQISWEFNATQNVSKKVAMGFQGYLLKQVTDDSVKGVTVGYNGNRTQLLGLGPQVRVAVPEESSPLSISMRLRCAITRPEMHSGLSSESHSKSEESNQLFLFGFANRKFFLSSGRRKLGPPALAGSEVCSHNEPDK